MTPPKQFGKLHSAIRAKLEALTPTERRIASYFLEQTQEIALTSVQGMAQRLQTGPASIVRVVRKLGYNGIAALKKELHGDILSIKSPMVQFKSTLSHGLKSGREEMRGIAEQELKNIEETIAGLDERSFDNAVRLVVNARHIYTLGIGISSHLAAITSFILRRIGLHADNIHHTGLPLTESIVTLGKEDLLVAFSLPPYSQPTIEAATFARSQGLHVLGFTDRQLAPIVEHCTTVLIGRTQSRLPTNSLSSILLLVDGVASAAAAKARVKSSKALEKTLKLRKARGPAA